MVAVCLGAGVDLRRWGGGGSEPLPDAVAPALVQAPELAGSGLIGEAVTLQPGAWSGQPAPVLAQQWLRDGAAIPGASGASHVPGAADDLTALSCRVTATNAAGCALAETAALAIARAAPAGGGTLADLVAFQGSGAQAVAAAAAFAGEGLAFSVSGAGATVHPATGLVSVPTTAAVAGATVTVTATNSGGAASRSFAVTVIGAPVALPGPHPWGATEGEGLRTRTGAALFATAGDPAGATVDYALVAGGAPVEAAVVWGGALVADASGYLRIDPATGILRLDTGASGALAAVAVPVRAANGAGAATATVTLTVAAVAGGEAPAVSDVAIGGPGVCWAGHTVAYVVAGDPTPAVSIQWRRNGAPIGGATGAGYVPVAADAGGTLSVAVTATNASGTDSATSAGVAIVNPELIPNGDFGDGGAGWTGGGSWSFSGGRAHQSGGNNLSRPFAFVAGHQYETRITVVSRASGQLRLTFNGGTGVFGAFRSAPGTYVQVLTANAGNITLMVNGSAVATIDDLSMKRIA